jgi:uncharacterized membrane protein
MRTNKSITLVAAALMAALTCTATVAVAIPSPTGGYIHPGDGFVILSGVILGPFFGVLAAGIGSMLADLILGYSAYAPATFIIKGLAALVAALLYQGLHRKTNNKVVPLLIAAIVDGLIVTSGYFLFEGALLGLGYGPAFMNVSFNLVQNVFGIIVSVLLFPLLLKVPQIRSIMKK